MIFPVLAEYPALLRVIMYYVSVTAEREFSDLERKKNFLITLLYYLSIAALFYAVLKYAIFVVMPFLIGFFIAASLNPIVRYLKRKFDLKQRPTAILILLIFYATIGMLVSILIVRLTVWFGSFSKQLPELYSDTVEPIFESVSSLLDRTIERLDGFTSSSFASTVSGILDSLQSSVSTAVSDLSVRALAFLSGFAAAVPGFVVELLFAVISSFFFIIDYEELVKFAKSRLPKKAVGIMTDMRDKFFVIALRYLRSYAFIMLITFTELLIGLLLIGTENAAVYALLIALFDVLPVVGTGAIMIPWAFVELFRGNVGYGVGLLIVWGAVTVIRNIIEPRIVGKQVGLHPLCALIAMFVGAKLFGFLGLILLPLALSIIISVIRDRDHSSAPT